MGAKVGEIFSRICLLGVGVAKAGSGGEKSGKPTFAQSGVTGEPRARTEPAASARSNDTRGCPFTPLCAKVGFLQRDLFGAKVEIQFGSQAKSPGETQAGKICVRGRGGKVGKIFPRICLLGVGVAKAGSGGENLGNQLLPKVE